MANANTQIERARWSLEGLSVGDAFGETFFVNPDVVEGLIDQRALAGRTWTYTDDTLMALSIFSELRQRHQIDQPSLVRSFAERYEVDRGYGPAMHRLLSQIRAGDDWKEASESLFEGQGSFGNGAAMRVGPLGAFFADDLHRVIEQAALSAVVTHAHEEAIAGAIAVAISTAVAYQLRNATHPASRSEFLDLILPHIPKSEVRTRVRKARDMNADASLTFAVAVLGNGVQVSAQDTVPLSLWCAGTHLTNYEEALWLTVSAQGDRDTTCAIVGGIVATHTGGKGIPDEWLELREPLPTWPFE